MVNFRRASGSGGSERYASQLVRLIHLVDMSDSPVPVIQVRGATVRSEGTDMVRDLTFRVAGGQHTAVLGANGAGKSTLLDLLTFRRRPYAGEDGRGSVRVFGRDDWDVFDLRSRLGVVSSDLHARFRERGGQLEGRSAVASGFFSTPGIPQRREITPSMDRRSRAALDRMNAGYLSEKPIRTMSHGEIRRVLIARALAPDPDALLLDEPTTGLDLAGRRRLTEILRELARSGTTILLTTHHVEEIFPEIDRVILLEEGTITADAPKPHVLNAERLSEAYGAQIEVRARRDGYYEARVAS